MHNSVAVSLSNTKLSLHFSGEFTIYTLHIFQAKIDAVDLSQIQGVELYFEDVLLFDTAASLFVNALLMDFSQKNIIAKVICSDASILATIELVKKQNRQTTPIPHFPKRTLLEIIGRASYHNYIGFLSFMGFLGKLFATKLSNLRTLKNIRIKEIIFEMHESAIKALGIIAITSFLIGLVVAYQSAFQLKIYGANIFIVDMLGISILRELSPLITAIVIAGRSGSAYTAQIGAMKITEELDAMRTMGFDPYVFLVLPRIIALMIVMPLLIFVSDMMAILGGMVVANLDLNITVDLFLDRFSTAVAAKHFFVGIVKGPFFAFLIASIGIYRGLMVKNDTQSIGLNTTKSVVESIFAVIVCDAIFSIAFTNLGI